MPRLGTSCFCLVCWTKPGGKRTLVAFILLLCPETESRGSNVTKKWPITTPAAVCLLAGGSGLVVFSPSTWNCGHWPLNFVCPWKSALLHLCVWFPTSWGYSTSPGLLLTQVLCPARPRGLPSCCGSRSGGPCGKRFVSRLALLSGSRNKSFAESWELESLSKISVG